MVALQTIEQLKQTVRITDYLHSKSILPVNSTGRQYVYRSPLTGEKTGSFFVEPERNVFNDFSSGEKGDNIRLVRLLERLDFVSAINRLKEIQPVDTIQFFNADIIIGSTEFSHTTQCEITSVQALQHKALINYVESRAIPYAYAFPFVKEIHYTKNSKKYFGVGFQTDKGSFAIRSENFKTWIGSSAITTIETLGSDSVNLFEGFFDFLSALVYFRIKKMRNTTIILNSNSNLKQAMEILKGAKTVYTFLDSDGKGNNGGLQALERLKKEGCNVVDRSNLYAGYKDFNERLQAL